MAGVVPAKVTRALGLEQAQLIHAHFGVDALDAWPVARALNVPMVVTLHGYDIRVHHEWWERGRAGFRMRFYPRRLLQMSKDPRIAFIAVSESIRDRAIEFGIPHHKIWVRYIGVDQGKFSPGSVQISRRAPRVLFVGRLVEKKGCAYLIEAMANVRRQIPAAQLAVVGDGPLRGDLEQLANLRGLQIEFLGSLPNNEVRHQLDQARLFCLPSVTAENGDAEGLPISILEAQASGVPVVTSALGAVGEAVKHGVNGLCFSERDVDELTSQLLTILSNDVMADEMASASVRSIRDSFDHRLLAAQLEATYDEAARLAASA
nr:glycosyltransferase [Bradyrhizobium sp. 142]